MDEKQEFLEKILQFAEQNPALVRDGCQIFQDDMPPVYEEACLIELHLDDKQKPYFRYYGGHVPITKEDGQDIFTAKELLEKGRRYFPKDDNYFKRLFHLYVPKPGVRDAFDPLR